MERKPINEGLNRRQLLQRGLELTAGFAMTPLLSPNAHAADNAESLLKPLKPAHPRLIATPGSWDRIKMLRAKDPLLAGVLARSEKEARAILFAPPEEYKKIGRRLLHTSRRVLRRVVLLATHYNLTGDKALAERAKQEMLAAAAFSDWNPSHFLDVGEMTAALAFGYDWLYDALDETSRDTIASAIITHGLQEGIKNDGGASSTNNWNSVCLCGLTLGALAVAEKNPALAEQILAKTKKSNVNGMKPYAPAGVYPEGAMYWGYGTLFQVTLLSALSSALGTDWGLSKSPGFLASAESLLHQLGPTGTFFNFSDGVERPSLEGATFWYAHELNRPDLLFYEQSRLKNYAAGDKIYGAETENERLLPLVALWWQDGTLAPQKSTLPTSWYGRGAQSLATFRSAWDDPKGMYLATKGGAATLSHGHMDAGSFIFEANGVRWAHDLGMQDYNSLESKGVDLWNSKQTSDRWKVYRIGPIPHNTLTINGQLHHAAGLAAVTHFSGSTNRGAVIDMTKVFPEQATRVQRGYQFHPESHVLIRDEIEGLKAGDTVRWAMLTRADVAINGNVATLTQNGQTLRIHLNTNSTGKWETGTADPPAPTDAPNIGFRLLTAQVTPDASGKVAINVTLQTTGATPINDKLADVPLERWGLVAV